MYTTDKPKDESESDEDTFCQSTSYISLQCFFLSLFLNFKLFMAALWNREGHYIFVM